MKLTKRQPWSPAIVGAIAVAAATSAASAQSFRIDWAVPTGNALTPGNWNPSTQLPNGLARLYINNGGTATFDNAFNGDVHEFRTGDGAAATGTANLTGSTVNITNSWFNVGNDGGTGTVNLNNATVTKGAGTPLLVGTNNAASNGTLTLAGASVINAGANFQFGQVGTANVTLGGTSALNVGTATPPELGFAPSVIGIKSGTGPAIANVTLNDSATMTLATELWVGQNRGATAALTLNGSSIVSVNQKNTLIGAGGGADAETSRRVTLNGNSTFAQDGGILFVGALGGTGQLLVNDNATLATNNNNFHVGSGGGTSLLRMTGGTIDRLGTGEMFVGVDGEAGSVGRYEQTGGTLNFGNEFQFGRGTGQRGEGEITGGVITGGAMRVGFNGTSSGEVRIAGTAEVNVRELISGFANDAVGNVLVEGNAVVTAVEVVAGYIGGAPQGNMIFGGNSVVNCTNFSRIGATSSAVGTLTIRENATFNVNVFQPGFFNDSTGTVNLEGGTLAGVQWAAGNVNTSEATFNQSGGTHTQSLLGWLAFAEGSTGTYNLSGGTVSQLEFRVGGGGNGLWNQTGGTASSTTLSVGTFVGPYGNGFNANGFGIMNVSAGTYTNTGNTLIGGQGTGQVNVSGTGVFDNNLVAIAESAGSNGTLTLTGGEFRATQLLKGAGTGSIAVNGGTLLLKPGTGLNAAATVSTVANITFGGGKLNVSNNAVIVDYDGASPLTALTAALRSAVTSGGASGIVGTFSSNRGIAAVEKSAVPAAGLPAIFSGADATSVLLYITLKGDTDINGTVGFPDLVTLAQNYNQTGRTWINGDFDYDGTVGFPDLVSLAQNYNQMNGAPGALPGGDAFAADWALAQSLVPEPTLALAGLIGAAGLVRRRR